MGWNLKAHMASAHRQLVQMATAARNKMMQGKFAAF
jgi:hypothetical protein